MSLNSFLSDLVKTSQDIDSKTFEKVELLAGKLIGNRWVVCLMSDVDEYVVVHTDENQDRIWFSYYKFNEDWYRLDTNGVPSSTPPMFSPKRPNYFKYPKTGAGSMFLKALATAKKGV